MLYQDLCGKYPICSIEDPMDENDWEGFASVSWELLKVRLLGTTFLSALSEFVNLCGIKESSMPYSSNF